MAPAHDFSKMVPGFDFLQGLVKNASSALPSLGQWVAPTLDPEELAKRIEELKTVQFWLEQNARMIGTTVQALEVQRMTLTTLKTMNVQVADLAQAFKLPDPVPASVAAGAAAATAGAEASDAPTAPRARTPRGAAQAKKAPPAASAPPDGAAPGVVDPMQWWGALTQQFTQLAAQALKERQADGAAGAAARTPAAAGNGTGGTARKAAGASRAPGASRQPAAGRATGGRAAKRKA
jgi:hypothetical protein